MTLTPLELFTAILGALAATAAAAWYFARSHAHPELVTRVELQSLEALLRQQHQAVLRELDVLRDDLNRPRR